MSVDEYNEMICEIFDEVSKIRQSTLSNKNVNEDTLVKNVSEKTKKKVADIKAKYKNKHSKDFK